MKYPMFGLLTAIGIGASIMMVFNSKVGGIVGFLEATFIFMFVGSSILAIPVIFDWTPGKLSLLNEVPRVYLLAGVMNIAIVAVWAYAITHFGPGRTLSVVITAQILTTQVMDHFGILTEQRPLTILNMVGALTLITGLILVVQRD